MSASRADMRKHLASLLETALVGNDKPAAAVFDYQVGDFNKLSPIVTVTSGPIERRHQGFAPCWHTTVTLLIHVFVLYADGNGWTEENAEDAIDDIEATVADVLLANPQSDYWHKATYAEQPTLIDGIEIAGVEYRREVIAVQMEVIEN